MHNEKKSLIKQMTPYIKGMKLSSVFVVIGAILSSLVTVYGPQVLKEITNLVIEGLSGNLDLELILHLSIMLGTMYVIGAGVGYTQSFIMVTLIQKYAKRIRTAIAAKINRLPLNYFDLHPYGDTLSCVTNDVDTAIQALNQSLGILINSVFLLVMSVVMMFITDVKMSLTAILSVFSGFVLSMLIILFSQKYFKAQQKNLAAISGFIEESYSGHHVITSYNAVNDYERRFNVLNEALYGSMWKSQFFSGIMMPMMIFIGNFGYVMVCVVGALSVLNGEITMGIVVAFMTYVRIFSQPLGQMAQGITSLQQAGAAMTRVFNFLEQPEMRDEKNLMTTISDTKGEVRFEHVSFGYLTNQTIIHDFSAIAKSGQKIAIVGPTGAGKTTLVNLLMKFYEVNKGEIFIDGVSLHDMKREVVHDQFSMVLQDTWLFEGTVRENLIYNQEHISDEQMLNATKAVGVHHFITTLPNGYDTILNDTVTLSVGQKQLLTIARALLKDAPLLILDEATSSVDTRTEELLQKAMDKLMEGKTSFVIAHRLSTIKNADLILVLKNGNIIEQGNHNELIALNGFYANLYNSQFENEGEG